MPKAFQYLSPQRRKCFNPCLLSAESVSIPVSSASKVFQSLSPQRRKRFNPCLLSAKSIPVYVSLAPKAFQSNKERARQKENIHAGLSRFVSLFRKRLYLYL